MNTIVMKFGGASVSSPARILEVAKIIQLRRRECTSLVVVVSAMGSTTDELIKLAHEIHPNPPQREFDMLISAGERISMSLLAMALDHQGERAMSFTGSQSGIITNYNHSNASIIDVKPSRILECLASGKIAIVAGFQGVSKNKEITTLGRGGSDTTAVALALSLDADKLEFYKNVPGIFDCDPIQNTLCTQFEYLTYDESLKIVEAGAKVMHDRALLLAKKNGLKLHVRSFLDVHASNSGTYISDPTHPRREIPTFEEEIPRNDS
jgi:aspartate kinase